MNIGGYDLYPIETGRFALDGGAMFGIVPKPLWGKANPADDRNRIQLAARGLLLVGHGRKILIDNGNGSKWSPKLIDIYKLDYTQSELNKSLKQVGLTPADITDVLLTHLHFDHAGGSTVREGDKLLPAFPNARHYVQKAHWDQARHPTEKDRGSFMEDDYMPLMEEGVLQLVDGEFEIFPNVHLIVLNGHTAAQQVPKISEDGKTLIYCCDLFPTTTHIPLPYIMAYDLRPLVTLDEKKKILKKAVDESWILYFEHDPNTVAGKVKLTEKGYVFGGEVAW
jgi:glyoxylase-like metal-dependent hydrolase (beta-lactamase superfamily II)